MITLIDNGKQLDLPSDVKISIEQNNPMFEEQGDFTLPLELPFSKNNLLLLNFPHRLDIVSEVIPIPVLLQAGLLSKKGILNMEEGKSISVSIIFEETVLYKKMYKTMEELFENEIFLLPDNRPNTPLGRVEYLEDIIGGIVLDSPFSVFPVIVKKDPFFSEGEILEKDDKWLNSPDKNVYKFYGNLKIARLWGHQKRTYNDGNKEIEIPIGYNTTPFLKLNWLLRKIFELLGYELTSNMFDTNDDLKKIVVLNNTRDALVATHFYLKFLLPTCTVKEFIDTMRYRFGCEFILSSDSKRVHLLTWNEVFDFAPTDDCQRVLQSQSSISFVSSKTLKITSKKIQHISLEKYATWQNFAKQWKEWHFNPKYLGFMIMGIAGSMREYIAFDIFDYYQGDYEALEFKTICSECSVYSVLKSTMPVFFTIVEERVPVLVIGSSRSCTTILSYDDGEEKKEEANFSPLIFCFSHGLIDEFNSQWRFTYGTAHSYDNDGNSNGNLHLTMRGEKGLFNRFLKKYDNVLRNKPYLLACQLDLKSYEILSYNFYRPVLIKGVKYLPSKLQYEITNNSIKVVSAEFRKI